MSLNSKLYANNVNLEKFQPYWPGYRQQIIQNGNSGGQLSLIHFKLVNTKKLILIKS